MEHSQIARPQVDSSVRSTELQSTAKTNSSTKQHQSPFHTRASIMQLQKTIGNRATMQLIQAQMQPSPVQKTAQRTVQSDANAPIQRQVEPGLKVATTVETLDGQQAKIMNQTATGYRVVILNTKKIQEFTFDELNMPQEFKQLPEDFLVDLFEKNNAHRANDRMKLATSTIDELFSKATKAAQSGAFPYVKSYSWIALGSYGRQEMCPYSDIELGIVYKVSEEYEESPDHQKIKENFSKFGAKVLEQLQKLAAFITLDSEGNFPSGKGGGTLMGDATGLAKSIAVASAHEAMDARHTMLMDARYLPATGSSDEAFQEFLEAKTSVMSQEMPDSDKTQGDVNASHLAKLALSTLKMCIHDVKKGSRFLDIKKNFRQPLDWTLMALCVKHGLFAAVGYEQRLKALVTGQFMDGKLAEKIANLYEAIFTTRIDLHLFHHEELDKVDTAPDNEEDDGGFNQEKIKKISSSNMGKAGLMIAELFMEIAGDLIAMMESLLE